MRKVRCLSGWGVTALLFMPCLAGCGSTATTQPAAMVQAAATDQRPRWVDLEDDGLEPQVPPPRREMFDADDPAEPFSPNYGSRPVNSAKAKVPI